MPAIRTRIAAMMATMDGRPSATQSAYTSAASNTAIRIPITSRSPFQDDFDGEPIVPAEPTNQSDLSIAIAAARAAMFAAAGARNAPLRARAKSVAADLVTDADAAAESAAARVLREHCPDDAIVGE